MAEEIKKSTGFIALQAKQLEYLDSVQKKLAGYVTTTTGMATKAFRLRCVDTYVSFLLQMSKGLIAVHNICNYDKVQALINLITVYDDNVLAPAKISSKYFLERLVLLQSLERIPHPTIENINDDFREQIRKMNGPSAKSLAEKAEQREKEKKGKEATEARQPHTSRMRATAHGQCRGHQGM